MVTKYVKIKGQSYPIKICQEAILQMAMDEGLSAEQVPALTSITAWPLKQMLLLILYSIRVACEQSGQECTLELKDIRHAIAEDEAFQDDIRKIGEQSTPVIKESKKKDGEATAAPMRKQPPR